MNADVVSHAGAMRIRRAAAADAEALAECDHTGAITGFAQLREGARQIWLGVWERNERAPAFYRKCGFRKVGLV